MQSARVVPLDAEARLSSSLGRRNAGRLRCFGKIAFPRVLFEHGPFLFIIKQPRPAARRAFSLNALTPGIYFLE